ncbi:hypothetical protein I5Q82_07020 [Acutalibacter muris]|jgi:hypothetical protein|uniref:Uncharacterized protein n=1 Tax=Acutalibacter muris TaxID=1796620 RepID=A0AA92QXC5_9FIRM|nr:MULTISPECIES: hypothetical protein [Acutalibacter]MCI9224384.1 hypothetical protein [Acutalibacter sp.]QQR31416.1 hypothetical protein I5Q82_07020 [Acutalibacter muris]
MNMTVIRYINNEPYRGEKLPAIEVENLGVVMVLKDLQHRLLDTPKSEPSDRADGKFSH